jgi:hypothetical protein
MRKNVSLHFWPRFSFGHVKRLRLLQETRRGGQTAIQVKLDLGPDKGRLYCTDLELLRLEEISCAREG